MVGANVRIYAAGAMLYKLCGANYMAGANVLMNIVLRVVIYVM